VLTRTSDGRWDWSRIWLGWWRMWLEVFVECVVGLGTGCGRARLFERRVKQTRVLMVVGKV